MILLAHLFFTWTTGLPKDLRSETRPHGDRVQQAKAIVEQVTGEEHANKGSDTSKGEGAMNNEEEKCNVLK